MCRLCLPVRARPLLSHPHVTSLLRLVQSQPVECTAPLYSPPLLVCLRIVVELARSTFCQSESKSCSSWRCRFSASQRETRYNLQVLHNIRLSSALFLASRSIENCSVMMSKSPPVLTVLHSAFCGPHNSPPCPPVQAHLKHGAMAIQLNQTVPGVLRVSAAPVARSHRPSVFCRTLRAWSGG